ncbi:hypothetical protein [Antarctobacter sp.]|uniref:hypothetical protein n=1 Tax=Antarctobacter sp. TaxID=1872577 RepID=UPI002B272A6B|nr:hypothetical protein [Antarctobacter sp.]
MTRIALIDGPLSTESPGVAEVIDPVGGARLRSPAGQHAAAIAAAIRSEAPDVAIISIPVFQGRLAASVADLVTALRLAADTDAVIVHCSLGLGRNAPEVAEAIAALADRVIVASAVARGGPVWPAALPTVIAVQGDARCAPGQWSHLDLPTADFGACPRLGHRPDVAGPSIAAAHVTGVLAAQGVKCPSAAKAFLETGASFVGREHRTAET